MSVYLETLLRHKWYFMKSGKKLGVPLWKRVLHDWSKFLPKEYRHYKQQFGGADKNPDPAGFEVAWVSHQNKNPHHWEYWISRSHSSRDRTSGPIPMPEWAVREMVADWMAASMAYGTTGWDITEWLTAGYKNKTLNIETKITLDVVLLEQGIGRNGNSFYLIENVQEDLQFGEGYGHD